MNIPVKAPFRILIADDDVDDVQLTKDCFVQNHLQIDVNQVENGQLLIDHLKHLAITNQPKKLPQLILLDLNMPKKNGLEALKELKEDDYLKKIPVVIYTTSRAPKDIERAYQLGASCFINKPNSLEGWCEKMNKLGRFWMECVKVCE